MIIPECFPFLQGLIRCEPVSQWDGQMCSCPMCNVAVYFLQIFQYLCFVPFWLVDWCCYCSAYWHRMKPLASRVSNIVITCRWVLHLFICWRSLFCLVNVCCEDFMMEVSFLSFWDGMPLVEYVYLCIHWMEGLFAESYPGPWCIFLMRWSGDFS